jgi:hypothetical protein
MNVIHQDVFFTNYFKIIIAIPSPEKSQQYLKNQRFVFKDTKMINRQIPVAKRGWLQSLSIQNHLPHND